MVWGRLLPTIDFIYQFKYSPKRIITQLVNDFLGFLPLELTFLASDLHLYEYAMIVCFTFSNKPQKTIEHLMHYNYKNFDLFE
ncbi:hypothetical protein A8L45_19495 [Veronia pacifica]|uniref:Uncharacterized protein n=1 Tax=Veronia pacifica TaxID=1080227 RepID=A0A1C3EBP1_9GAMM|nr:hypothetical protein A8L45_19495 [Veronia pacifica]